MHAHAVLNSYRFNRRWDFIIALAIGLVALLVGSIGVARVILLGDHGALGSAVPWGLWVGVYVFFVWIEVGMILGYYALKHVLKVKGIDALGPVIVISALCALSAALAIIGMDLGQPFRAWRTMLFADFGSLMTWMIWMHTFYLGLLAVEFYAYYKDNHRLVHMLNWINIPAGIALIIIIGALFGVIAARPMWNSAVLPMAFAMSALVAGTGMILLLHLLFSPMAGQVQYRRTAQEIGRFLLWGLIIGGIAAFANLLVSLYAGVPARTEGMAMMLFGPYWWTIWIVHLGMGTLLPLILLVFFGRQMWALLSAAVLLICTFVMVPLNLVIPGLAYPSPELKGIAAAYQHPRLSYDYFPGLTEWLVVIFAIGLALTMFSVVYQLLLAPLYTRLAREQAQPGTGDQP